MAPEKTHVEKFFFEIDSSMSQSILFNRNERYGDISLVRKGMRTSPMFGKERVWIGFCGNRLEPRISRRGTTVIIGNLSHKIFTQKNTRAPNKEQVPSSFQRTKEFNP